MIFTAQFLSGSVANAVNGVM